MIEVKNLNVHYNLGDKKIQILRDINHKVKKGEICTIIGPSGAGKSTLLKVLAGIHKCYTGEVLLKDKKINTHINKIGFIPQNYGLIRWKTAKENILLSAAIKYGKRNVDMNFYESLVEKLNIKEILYKYPYQLSGGQKQRISIARAFLIKPELLLMDEPFSSIDIITKDEVYELFFKIWDEYKVTTLHVTHDIREALYLGEKFVVLSSNLGQIIYKGNNSFFRKNYCISMEYNKLYNKVRKLLKENGKLEN